MHISICIKRFVKFPMKFSKIPTAKEHVPIFIISIQNYHLGMNNKVLLYSTEDYIQYPIINYNRKEYFKKNIYIYTHN